MTNEHDEPSEVRLEPEPQGLEGSRRLARALAQDDAPRSPKAEPPRRSSESWLDRVVGRFTAARRARSGASNATPPAGTGSEELALQRRLVAELAALEEPWRGTIVRRFHHGRSAADVAHEDGTTEAAVRAREQHGLELLRERLDRRHDGNRTAWAALLLRFADGGRATRTAPAAFGAAVWLAAAVVLVGIGAATYFAQPGPLAGAEALAATIAEDEAASGAAQESPGRTPAAHADAAADARTPVLRFVGTVTGRVVDEEGAPLANAEIEPREDELAFEKRPPTRTDSGGRFSLELVAVLAENGWHGSDLPRYVQLDARRIGHAPALCKVVVPVGAPVDLGDVVLPRAGSVRGRVVDEARRPLSNVECVAATPDLEAAERARFPHSLPVPKAVLARTTTDAEGRFVFDALPIGFVRLFATPRGREPIASGTLEITAGALVEAGELLADPDPTWIEGVVRRADGSPFPRALVVAVEREPEAAPKVLTAGDDGAFGLRSRAHVDFHALGTARAPAEGAALDVAPGSAGLVLTAASAPSRTLVLRDRNGPIEGWISAEWELLPGTTCTNWGGKSRDGRLNFPRLPFATRVTVRAERYASALVALPAADGAVAPLDVELLPAALLSGRVVDEARAPVAGATVLIEYPAAVPIEGGIEGSFLVRPDAPNRVVMTGPDGSYLLAREHALPYQLVVHDRALRRSVSGPYLPGAAAEGEPRELVLGPFASIEGRVLVGAGDVVERKRVVASNGDGLVREAVPRRDGRFVLEGLSPGPWRVWADELLEGQESLPYPPCARTNVVAAIGRTTDVVLDLTRDAPCTLSGRIALEGVSTRAWTLVWHLEGQDEARALRVPIGPDGRFDARIAPARRTCLRASSDGAGEVARCLRWTEELEPGGRSIELELPTGALDLDRPEYAGREVAHVARIAHGKAFVEVETRVRLDARGRAERVLVPVGVGRMFLVDSAGRRADEPFGTTTLSPDAGGRTEPLAR